MKKLISLLLILALTVSICPAAIATSTLYNPYCDSVTTWEEQTARERDIILADPSQFEHSGITNCIIVDYGEGGLSRGVDPGEGAIGIFTNEKLYTTATIYWDSEAQSDAFGDIADSVLTYAGSKPGTVGKVAKVISIVKGVLEYNNIEGEISMQRKGHVKAGHSVSYLNKTGEFYHNNSWEVAVYTQQKYLFAHEHVVVAVDGIARQEVLDKVPENGFSAYEIADSPHFNDHTFIEEKTRQLYLEKKETGIFGAYDERWL